MRTRPKVAADSKQVSVRRSHHKGSLPSQGGGLCSSLYLRADVQRMQRPIAKRESAAQCFLKIASMGPSSCCLPLNRCIPVMHMHTSFGKGTWETEQKATVHQFWSKPVPRGLPQGSHPKSRVSLFADSNSVQKFRT